MDVHDHAYLSWYLPTSDDQDLNNNDNATKRGDDPSTTITSADNVEQQPIELLKWTSSLRNRTTSTGVQQEFITGHHWRTGAETTKGTSKRVSTISTGQNSPELHGQDSRRLLPHWPPVQPKWKLELHRVSNTLEQSAYSHSTLTSRSQHQRWLLNLQTTTIRRNNQTTTVHVINNEFTRERGTSLHRLWVHMAQRSTLNLMNINHRTSTDQHEPNTWRQHRQR